MNWLLNYRHKNAVENGMNKPLECLEQVVLVDLNCSKGNVVLTTIPASGNLFHDPGILKILVKVETGRLLFLLCLCRICRSEE